MQNTITIEYVKGTLREISFLITLIPKMITQVFFVLEGFRRQLMPTLHYQLSAIGYKLCLHPLLLLGSGFIFFWTPEA